MKHYRFKNEKEMVKSFGKDWRKTTGLGYSMDNLLGKDVNDCKVDILNHLGLLPVQYLVEVSPLAADIDKTYIDLEKGKVTVILKNGNTGRSSCAPGDVFDPQVGIALAYTRAIMGSTTQFKKYVDLKVKRVKDKQSRQKYDSIDTNTDLEKCVKKEGKK